MKIVTFLLSLCLGLSFSSVFAQDCDVENGTFKTWGTERLPHPTTTDSLDFFWPTGWLPFIWDGINDDIEPYLPGADGAGDTAVAIVSTDNFPSVSTYFLCEGSPQAIRGSYLHEGVADDSLLIIVFGVYVDTVGNSNVDTLVQQVLFDEIDYTDIFEFSTSIGGGAASFTNFEFSLAGSYENLDTVPNIVFVVFSHERVSAPAGQLTKYAIDNVELVYGTSSIGDRLADLAPIELYPNPASSQLMISTGIQTAYQAQVINMQGQQVSSYGLQAGDRHIEVQNLARGMYLLVLRDEKGEFLGRERFLVE